MGQRSGTCDGCGRRLTGNFNDRCAACMKMCPRCNRPTEVQGSLCNHCHRRTEGHKRLQERQRRRDDRRRGYW